MTSPRRARRRTAAPAAALVAAALLVAGCSDPKPDPAKERRDRIEQRLRSFSAAQSNCILERVDEQTLVALDRTNGLEADSAAMADYSAAVVACVADPDAPETTTTGGATSTTAAPTTTTG
ncbi:hypothetical protein KSP35_02120 [Aquihabitans sp. G128]|uniref:hypothetical protein n=1 Tax=Aquihabitans sp. G128 TaxID=2849779 RepID=UPI001C21892D|nr:hypothetical protein [Aquihabitans sp. G128]QXC61667.1 hypothetical protein KSP35_02120 [Aquihabitans sp. G128]